LNAAAAFGRLGIAPTRDIRSIKRAYALALKAIDQASEREVFERLREAYEQALAWAAAADDAGEQEAQGDDGDPDDGGDRSRAVQRPAPEPEPEPEPEPAPPPTAPEHHQQQPLPAAPAAAVAPPLAPDRDEARQALQHWTAQLRDAAPEDVAHVLEAALADPRLLHLDSHAQLEARIADLLHHDPAGRAVLFDSAAAHFHWTDRNARPNAGMDAAQWIFRVVNQGLQWRAQAPQVVELQNRALDVVAQVPSPQPAQTRQFAEVIDAMGRDFPEWFVLHLAKTGHAHRPRWQASLKQLAPGWTRQAERKERLFGNPRKTINTLLGGFFALLVVTAMLAGIANRVLKSAAPPAAVAGSNDKDTSGAGATAGAEPVLAYEFTGAVTRDSCESAEEFVHASNWLETDDADAMALLATRAIRCQEKGWWTRKDDALMACLRAERSAALGAGRAENASRCR